MDLQWFLDEMCYFRGTLHLKGWAYHPTQRVQEIGCILARDTYVRLEGYGKESADVVSAHGAAAENCRFETKLEVSADAAQIAGLRLVFVLEDDTRIEIANPLHRRLHCDPYYILQERFFKMLAERKSGSILELGSRDRRYDVDPFPLLQSSYVREHLIPKTMRHVGTDIVAAPNVHVVGDAHHLSSMFRQDEFDAVYAAYVFEHLIMPWKVTIELNRIMKTGGLVLVLTHHTWPLHEQPWDFWRFSNQAWQALFNHYTGFRIVDTALGEPSSIVAQLLHTTTVDLDMQAAPLFSGVIAEKTGKSKVRWDVDPADVLKTCYPK